MQSRLIALFLFTIVTGIHCAKAQGFKPPAEGKAVIYFARVSDYGFAVSFEFFHGDKYIGVFKGKNYMRYELDPGEQLLWASSENKEFITSDLQAGASYIVIVDVIMGAWKAHVGLTPIGVNDAELFERAKKLIMKEAPVITPEEKIAKTNIKLAEFIPKQLEKYEKDWKNTKNFKHIAPEMAIPADAMK
jgi:hypothetical protein